MEQTNKVIALGPPKEAALYFEEVLPLDLSYSWLTALGIRDSESEGLLSDIEHLGIPFDGASFDEKIVESLMPRTNNAADVYVNQLAAGSWLPLSLILAHVLSSEAVEDLSKHDSMRKIFAMGGVSLDEVVKSINNNDFNATKYTDQSIPIFSRYVERAGFRKSPTWLSLSGRQEEYRLAGSTAAYAVALKGLELVDPKSVAWDHILEFRKDPTSRNSLRRFRLFFSDNLEGKSPSYIQDKLLVSLDEYKKTSKVWGFPTIQKTLSVAVSSQNVINSSLGALAPILSGAPLQIAAGIGAVITLSNCALEFSKTFVDVRNSSIDSPMSYLAKLKNLGD